MNNNDKSKDKKIYGEEIERVLRSGEGKALRDSEIIKVFLRSVHSENQAQAIAEKLMDTCTGIGGILGRSMDELRIIKGVTEPAVAVMTCVQEAGRRASIEGLKKGPIMDQEKLIEYIRVRIGFSAKEAIQIIFLDTQSHFIGEEVYFGTIDRVHLYAREVVEKAFSRRAASIVLAHNHPGGSLEPSEDDRVMTRELAAACEGVEIELKDHIITTDKGHFSFMDHDLL